MDNDIVKIIQRLEKRVEDLEKKSIPILVLSNQGSAPSTPPAGHVVLYIKTSDKKLYYKDETGTERLVNTTP